MHKNSLGIRLHVRGDVMKQGRLYIKIFLTFLLLFLVTLTLIFSLFREVNKNSFRRDMENKRESEAFFLKTFYEGRLRELRGLPDEKERINGLLRRTAHMTNSMIWLETGDGMLIARSFAGPVPPVPRDLVRGRSGFFSKGHRPHDKHYMLIRLRTPQNKYMRLNVMHLRPNARFNEEIFALGLAGIALVLALLLFLFSRYITVPLNRLKDTATRIAAGDLAQRVHIKSSDEIGELGRSFNTMAEKVERMVTGTRELAANISHELRSPLARIMVSVEILSDRLREEGAQSHAQIAQIEQEISEMDSLIGQILELSRADINAAEKEKESLDPEALLSDIINRFKPMIESRGLSLKIDLDPGKGRIQGCTGDLSRALANVLDNAVKYTPENGSINVLALEKDGFSIITVENSAPPMPGPELDRIFEPFYRAPGTAGPGTGLGLAITRKIIENHNGTVRAAGSDMGVSISILLPLEG